MATPKRKTSKSKIKMRKRSHKKSIAKASTCSQTGAPTLSHRVCPTTGTYKGRQVLTITEDS